MVSIATWRIHLIRIGRPTDGRTLETALRIHSTFGKAFRPSAYPETEFARLEQTYDPLNPLVAAWERREKDTPPGLCPRGCVEVFP
jgi:hypothetical protein